LAVLQPFIHFVEAVRRYRTVIINTGTTTVTAEDPLPDKFRTTLAKLIAH
jgi:hypothetical protein